VGNLERLIPKTRAFVTRGYTGFTLVELLVSVVIMGIAIASAVQLSNIALSGSRGNASAEVRNLIRRDLNWLTWYSKAWKCAEGCTPSTANQLLEYNVTSATCNSIAPLFRSGEGEVAAYSTRPFPDASLTSDGKVEIQKVNGVALTRVIEESGKTLLITYEYLGQPRIDRFSSVRIQAAESCTSP
jgi:prepilin-type N-terminal cleavage/methylation domain-containing protein